MKNLKLLTCLGVVISSFNLFGIEDLRISVSGTNAILNWPSVSGEKFIIQYRPILDPAGAWVTLTNGLLAATGTNRTWYLHRDVVRRTAGVGSTNSCSTCPLPSPYGMSSSSMLSGPSSEGMFLPPLPWDEAFQSTPIIENDLLLNQSTEMQSLSSEQSTPEGYSGFYKVVREGIWILGLTNGSSLLGSIIFPTEIGYVDIPSFVGIDVSLVDGSAVHGLTIVDEVTPTLYWDTTQMTNGTYSLVATAVFGEGVNTVIRTNQPITVTLNNQIWFPDPLNLAGTKIDVQAQSIHLNGNYRVQIYEDSPLGLNLILEVDGTNDSQGFITDRGFRGIWLENLDQNGNQYTNAWYDVVVRTGPSGPAPQALVNNNTTNRIFIERLWPSQGSPDSQFAIAYQPVYGQNTAAAGVLREMISLVYAFAEARPGYNTAIRGDAETPNELWSQGDFNTLLTDLALNPVRNLYYFGHGAKDYIGNKKAQRYHGVQYLDTPIINFTLKNNFKNPWAGAGTNAHPYRFVFLDGCETAKGDLCKAFGIPRERDVAWSRFSKKGLRARAFLGWKGFANESVINSVNQQHITFIADLFEGWRTPKPDGNPRSLREAHTYAATLKGTSSTPLAFANELVIYGYEGLKFWDTVP